MDLFRVTDTGNTTEQTLSWDVYSTSVLADTTSTALSQRCENIGTVDIDLTTKHGKLNAGLQKGQNVKCFVDTSLDVTSLFGKTLTIKSSDGTILSCATIRQVMKRTTMTRIDHKNSQSYDILMSSKAD